jgi:hypothetical protein
MVYQYVRNNGHGLTIYVNFIVKYVYYMVHGSNGCFVIGAALMDDHYRTNIISGVGHPRSDSVVQLVLCMVLYNIRSTSVDLEVPRESANPAKKG